MSEDALAGLERIDWSMISHAYGPATDVPGQLKALTSVDSDARSKAMWELWGNIHHQGTVYEASAFAVPFLARLAAEPGPQPRGEILLLLLALACGSSYMHAHRGLLEGGGYRWSDEDERQQEVELRWVAEARAAVDAAASSLIGLISHEELAIRVPAIALCASFPNLDQPVRAVARARALADDGDALAQLCYQVVAVVVGTPISEVVSGHAADWARRVLEASDSSEDVTPEGLLSAIQIRDGEFFIWELITDLVAKILSRELR